MNADFIMAQLRVAFVAVVAYLGGRGIFTPADAALATALATSLAPILVPWIFSIVSNYGKKRVPQDSLAIETSGDPLSVHHIGSVAKVETKDGATVGKIVGALLFAVILFAPASSFAQSPSHYRVATLGDFTFTTPQRHRHAVRYAGPILDRIKADAAAKVVEIRAVIVADLEAARDDAKQNDDPASGCWIILLDHANRMPPKLMGVAHTAQRLRTLRRSLPAILDACAVVKEGAKQALLQIFGSAAGGLAGLTALGF